MRWAGSRKQEKEAWSQTAAEQAMRKSCILRWIQRFD